MHSATCRSPYDTVVVDIDSIRKIAKSKSEFDKMTSKLDKEKQKTQQEKYQNILSALLRDEDNKYCVDCDAKGIDTNLPAVLTASTSS